MLSALFEVSDCATSRALCSAFTVNTKLAPKACAVRRIAPRFIGLEISSAPTANQPRVRVGKAIRRFYLPAADSSGLTARTLALVQQAARRLAVALADMDAG